MANLKHHTIGIHGGFRKPFVHFVRTVHAQWSVKWEETAASGKGAIFCAKYPGRLLRSHGKMNLVMKYVGKADKSPRFLCV